MMMNGTETIFGGKLITIFSAPNYSFRSGNRGAIMEILEDGEYEIKEFTQKNMQRDMQG